MGEPRYVTLMSSLPYHGRLFGARQTPLSRFQLDKRLAWLSPEDAETLRLIESILQWRRLLLRQTDAAYLDEAEKVVAAIDNPLLVEVVTSRLEARTLIAALRMRRAGRTPPGGRQRWGFGRWMGVIERHWSEADFGLAKVFPWVAEAQKQIDANDALGLERLFMNFAWKQLAKQGAGHFFDFEAVCVYVLRWDMIDRWTKYEAEVSRQRVLELADEALGEYAALFPDAVAA